jgi:hypothetical protein
MPGVKRRDHGRGTIIEALPKTAAQDDQDAATVPMITAAYHGVTPFEQIQRARQCRTGYAD